MNICLYHRISKVSEGKRGTGRKGGGEGGYIRTLESGRLKRSRGFWPLLHLAHAKHLTGDWMAWGHGAVGSCDSCFEIMYSFLLIGYNHLKETPFHPDRLLCCERNSQVVKISSSLKSKDPKPRVCQRLLIPRVSLQETNLSWPWSLKSL